MIKAVLFDIDGVLLDSFEANLRFFQTLFPKAGYEAPTREEYKNLFHVPMYGVIEKLTKGDKREVDRVFELAKSSRVDYLIELLSYPKGAFETIQELHKTYKLGVVSSRVGMEVWEIPLLKKMKPLLSTSIFFEDTEKHKPDPEPLFLAAERIGIEVQKCVYIGDAITDVQAGEAAGMKVIAYPKMVDGADILCEDFEKLPEIVASL